MTVVSVVRLLITSVMTWSSQKEVLKNRFK